MFFMAHSMLYFVFCFFLFVCFCNRLILHGCWIPFFYLQQRLRKVRLSTRSWDFDQSELCFLFRRNFLNLQRVLKARKRGESQIMPVSCNWP